MLTKKYAIAVVVIYAATMMASTYLYKKYLDTIS